jgi:hypothetical protein
MRQGSFNSLPAARLKKCPSPFGKSLFPNTLPASLCGSRFCRDSPIPVPRNPLQTSILGKRQQKKYSRRYPAQRPHQPPDPPRARYSATSRLGNEEVEKLKGLLQAQPDEKGMPDIHSAENEIQRGLES